MKRRGGRALVILLALSGAPGLAAAGPAESVLVRASCEAMHPSFCVGTYGFSLAPTGAWQAGPGPDGRVLTGAIPKARTRRVFALADPVLARSTSPESGCAPPLSPPGVSERVTVTGGGRAVELHGSVDGTLVPGCGDGSPALRRRLFREADAVMRAHYPNPWPAR